MTSTWERLADLPLTISGYELEDRYCVVCGHETLEGECACGRRYDYLQQSDDESALHCPRCGKVLRGRQKEFDA